MILIAFLHLKLSERQELAYIIPLTRARWETALSEAQALSSRMNYTGGKPDKTPGCGNSVQPSTLVCWRIHTQRNPTCTLGLVDALNSAPALLPTEPTQGRNYKSAKCGRDSATICFCNLFEKKPRNSVWLKLQPEKAMAPHSSTLAWKIPWMEPGRLQSMGSLRVGQD